MKYLIIITFLFNFSSVSAQSKFYGEVDYTYTTNFSFPYTASYLMKFNDKASFSEEVNIESSEDKNLSSTSENSLSKNIFIGRKNITSQFYYNSNETLYFREIFSNKTLLVEDDAINLNWEFLDDIKQIGSFLCQKAQTEFRGRTYTAWYTKGIPYSYGPWKFSGLPGLILEVYDNDDVFHLSAKKVRLQRNAQDNSLGFSNEMELKNAMTIEDYLSEKLKIVKANFARLSSKRPKGTKPIVYDENCDDCRDRIEYFK